MGNFFSSKSEIKYPKPFSGKIKFDSGDVLGDSKSPVCRGTFDGQTVAVKQIWKKQVKTSRADVETSLTEVDREIEAQIHLKHENVVKMITAEEDKNFRY